MVTQFTNYIFLLIFKVILIKFVIKKKIKGGDNNSKIIALCLCMDEMCFIHQKEVNL
jgi:hypothetical protein